MGECEFMDGCAFFNGDRSEELKEKYCRNNNLNCARYMIANAVGNEAVPDDLAPDQKDQAYMIIAEKS